MSGKRLPLVLVPCFSGAPWKTEDFPAWRDRILVTGQLPDAGGLDRYANLVASWTEGLDEYAMVGDSFGASVALALAERRPAGLRALVMSGGFAEAHLAPTSVARVFLAMLTGQPGYRLTVKLHVRSLGSRFDPPGTAAELRDLFLAHSDNRTFVHRGLAVVRTDLRPGLGKVRVPTLILTPEEDHLIGPAAARELVEGIPDAEERVLPGTGHLLRFTHEREYAAAVDTFLAKRLQGAEAARALR
jgi:pimeloyl-ACP methyl ester carboxylesterase